MIAAFLERYRSGGPWQLVSITPDKKQPPVAITFHDAADAEAWALDRNKSANVYFAVNPTTRPLNKKAEKADIARVEYFHVDLDPRIGEDLQSERERIRKRLNGSLTDDGIPPPSLVIDTGGGFAAYWRLAQAIEINGDPVKIAEAERYNIELANRLGGDHCHDVSRIMRCPGTRNWPDKKKRARGRVPADAEIYDWPALEPYALSAFPSSVARPPQASSDASGKAHPRGTQFATANADPAESVSTDDLMRWANEAGHKIADATLALIATGDASEYGGDRSRMVNRVVCDLVRAEVPDALILGAILDKQNPVSAHVYDQKGNKLTYARRQLDRARQQVATQALERAVTSYGDSDYTPQWCPTTKEGAPVKSFHNTVEALQTFGLSFSYDVFHDQRVISGHRLQDYAGNLTDGAAIILRREVRRRFGFDSGKDALHDAIAELCEVNRRDSLLDHLEALPEWDGVPRVDRWLIDYCGAEDSAYVRAVGSAWLLAAVLRAFQPGAKFDYMLILVGEQGMKKSMALEVIAGGKDFFSDAALLGARDGREVLELSGGVWIQECAELDGITKKDVSALKALITRTHDKARKAWGRAPCDVPRRFVLAGTTNERRFLQDPTGNRRFWPVDVTRIDLDGLAAARDQLMAEALVRYRAGDRRLWLQDEAATQAKRIQGERVVVDESYFELLEFLKASGKRDGEVYVTNARVYRRLGLDAARRAGNIAHRVRAVMAALGWKPATSPITVDGTKQRIYIWAGDGEPPEIEPDPPF